MSEDELYELAKSVKSRGDFTEFVDLLRVDRDHNRNSWQNDSLDAFLRGLSAFSRDMEGYYKNMGEAVNVESISWRMAAQMLLAATVYGS